MKYEKDLTIAIAVLEDVIKNSEFLGMDTEINRAMLDCLVGMYLEDLAVLL